MALFCQQSQLGLFEWHPPAIFALHRFGRAEPSRKAGGAPSARLNEAIGEKLLESDLQLWQFPVPAQPKQCMAFSVDGLDYQGGKRQPPFFVAQVVKMSCTQFGVESALLMFSHFAQHISD